MHARPLALQSCSPEQSILNLLWQCVAEILHDGDLLAAALRDMKDAFAVRDYDRVFDDPQKLAAYVANYTSSRALCYYGLFSDDSALAGGAVGRGLADALDAATAAARNLRVVCLGGGSGGEFLALARFAAERQHAGRPGAIELVVQDRADYGAHLAAMLAGLRDRWALEPERFSYTTAAGDLLDGKLGGARKALASADIVTAGFVVNELFQQDRAKATRFLLALVAALVPGALLLVVDSAGSFSDLAINGRPYAVYDLLDRVAAFERVSGSDSLWHRVPSGLSYGLKLHSTRFFYRLYRRLS